MIQARYSFGEDFRFSRSVDLPFGYLWRAVVTLRDAAGRAIGPLDCQVVGIEPAQIVITASAAMVDGWPRPSPSGESTFYFDYQVYDAGGDTVMSSETVELAAESSAYVGDIVSREFEKIPTQYREAWKLQAYMRAALEEVEAAAQVTARIPTFFDIDTAVGDQLTIIGKWLGFPRCHCICVPNPVFGFACVGPDAFPGPIVGFCEGGNWLGCDGGSLSEYCIGDDEVYRGFLKARRYQMLGLFDRESLVAALRHVWGLQAYILHADRCRVVVAPGRPLDTDEATRNQIPAACCQSRRAWRSGSGSTSARCSALARAGPACATRPPVQLRFSASIAAETTPTRSLDSARPPAPGPTVFRRPPAGASGSARTMPKQPAEG